MAFEGDDDQLPNPLEGTGAGKVCLTARDANGAIGADDEAGAIGLVGQAASDRLDAVGLKGVCDDVGGYGAGGVDLGDGTGDRATEEDHA
jgi:hypothetical protein